MDEYTILEQLKIRLRQFSTDTDGGIVFNQPEENPILEQLIREAIQDVRTTRKYPSSWTEDQIEEDLENYKQVVIKLAMYDYVKEGADFETQNNENGETRTYVKRESLLADVIPFVTVL